MFFQFPISVALAFAATAIASPLDSQQPIFDHSNDADGKQVDLIKELEKAHIIPSILDPFTPLLTLNATWKKATAEVGNTIKPKKAKKEPLVHFLDTVPLSLSSAERDGDEDQLRNLSPGIQLTIALTDPDAPSRSNPKWSQMCHWIATDVQLSSSPSFQGDGDDSKHSHHQTLTEIMPYKPPGPPPRTGRHRYIFVALAPTNGTTEKLNLSQPKERRRWGFEGEGEGLREWAGVHGLSVVGANFVYAQNKKQ